MKYFRYNWRNGLRKIRNSSLRKKLFISGLIGLAFIIVVPLITYANLAGDITDRERLMNRNSTGFVLKDRNGEIIYSFGHVNYQNNLKLSEISDQLENALVASEDQGFYKHEGFSMRGIAAAMYANVMQKDPKRYGGSTITQQLVKNNLLTAKRSYLRKYQEFSMAIAVERHYTKEEILEMYLNSVYFGEGAFGIGQAAKTYFNKSPQDLSLAESSMLVGVLPAPSTYSPISGDKEKAKTHQKRVLELMADAGFINEKEASEAEKAELKYQAPTTNEQKHAQHFSLMVLEELKKRYGEETIIRGGYEVTTTLDLNWQREAEKYVKERLEEIKNVGATNAGLVAIDPKNGEIRALVGSVNWDDPSFGKVNMAITPRQPGSSFKPIYYTESMDKKLITPATILEDEPRNWDTYRPQNYDFRFRGDIPVRKALALSLNIPAVEVMEKLGVKQASETAQRMGISTVNEPDKYGLSLALGTAEVKLLEMTNAYAAFANQGNQFKASDITGIKDKFDRTIFSYKPESKRVTSGEASFLISSILSDREARKPTFGNSLVVEGRNVAVKTGTTDQSRDAWTIGYTPSLAVGVWVGDNQSRPMHGIAGSSAAAPIWKRSITSFLGNSPNENFERPKDVLELEVCKGSGLRAQHPSGNTYKEFFIKGGEPSEGCNAWNNKPKDVNQEDKKEPEKKEEDQGGSIDSSGEQGMGAGAPPADGSLSGTDGSGTGDGSGSPTPTDPPPEPAPTDPPPPATTSP